MKSLKELIAYQTLSGKQDIEIIFDWFTENNMEIEGISLMEKLATNKANRLANEIDRIKGNMSMYAGTDILFREYKSEIASKLNHIIVLYILGLDIEQYYPQHIKWLKETIPTLKCPSVFWRDFYEWLKSKGIYFKGEKQCND